MKLFKDLTNAASAVFTATSDVASSAGLALTELAKAGAVASTGLRIEAVDTQLKKAEQMYVEAKKKAFDPNDWKKEGYKTAFDWAKATYNI